MTSVSHYASQYEREFNHVLDHALNELGWDSFEMQGRDHLDFQEVSKFMMAKLLEHAFNAGGQFGAELTKQRNGLT